MNRPAIPGEHWRMALAAVVILLSVAATAMLALAADGRAVAPPAAVTAIADPCPSAPTQADCRSAQNTSR